MSCFPRAAGMSLPFLGSWAVLGWASGIFWARDALSQGCTPNVDSKKQQLRPFAAWGWDQDRTLRGMEMTLSLLSKVLSPRHSVELSVLPQNQGSRLSFGVG